jgi:hypothetical protein
MLTLANDQLEVSILDPARDQVRLGSRYCTGGYVYEVADRRLGVITSGPGYPDEVFPPVFDGQGLPEAFPSLLWPGVDPAVPHAYAAPGTSMLVLGVGLVEAPPSARVREMTVQEFCRWNVARSSTQVVMTTHQTFASWTLGLTRELTLLNRTLVSRTRLDNVGQDAILFRWFPHPFFPLPNGECCRFNLDVTFPENPGYELLGNGFIGTKVDHPWDRVGHFQALSFSSGERLVTLQRHPTLGLLAATCSYSPSYLPIWGNRNTFSFEPYLEQTVAPDASETWSITYDF